MQSLLQKKRDSLKFVLVEIQPIEVGSLCKFESVPVFAPGFNHVSKTSQVIWRMSSSKRW